MSKTIKRQSRSIMQDHMDPAYVKAYRANLEKQREEEARKTCLKPWMFQ